MMTASGVSRRRHRTRPTKPNRRAVPAASAIGLAQSASLLADDLASGLLDDLGPQTLPLVAFRVDRIDIDEDRLVLRRHAALDGSAGRSPVILGENLLSVGHEELRPQQRRGRVLDTPHDPGAVRPDDEGLDRLRLLPLHGRALGDELRDAVMVEGGPRVVFT